MTLPSTRTRTDHAMSISVNGQTIGHIQDWTPQQSRTVTPVYELDDRTSGTVIENVPGNIGGLTIGVNRFDLFLSRMEQVWGIADMNMLTDQSQSITVREKWRTITDENTGTEQFEYWTYEGVWFTSLGRTHSASGDRITKVNASFMYVRRVKTA